MSILKRHAPIIMQCVWLGVLASASIAVAVMNSNDRVRSYSAIADRIAEVDSKIDAMAAEKGFQFIPAPVRPERDRSL